MRRGRAALALAAVVALCTAIGGVARAQSANGPTRDVIPHGRVSALVWMIGNWDCRIVDLKQQDYATKAWRRIALGPGGRELFVLQGTEDLITRSKFGFSDKSRQWYEIDRVGDGPKKQQQTLVGNARALGPNGITLDGFVPGPHGAQYPLRGVYTWADHNSFVFRAQLLRRGSGWLTFQKESCLRTNEATQ